MSTMPAFAARGAGPWVEAWRRLRRDGVGLASLAVVVAFAAVMLLAGLGWLAGDWAEQAAVSHAPPSFMASASDSAPEALRPSGQDVPVNPSTIADPLAEALADIARDSARALEVRPLAASLPLGSDRWGRDVLKKVVKGTQTSMFVGMAAALLAVAIGTVLGALAGYYGGRIDDALNWVYSVFTAIPYLLLILAVAAVLNLKGTLTVVAILGLTGWTGVFRLIRAEYLKHRVREYVRSAEAIGVSHARRMFVHILPNVGHVVLVQLSLHAVLFMKSEVVLSFLGFGVGVDDVSWGSMIGEAHGEIILGNWWQLAAATAAMALLITAFSLLTDALRDAIDPRLR